MYDTEISYSQLMTLLNSKVLNECTIEITNACQFRCDHCYVEKSTVKVMKIEDFKVIIDQLLEINCNAILLTGGEPMLNPDFLDMYIYAKKMGMIVNINTTCFLLNKRILNTFIKYIPNSIEISLYGYDDKSYELFTHKKNSFEKVLRNIKLLKSSNINISLKTVLTKKNYYYIEELKEFARQYNIPFRYDYIVFPKLIDNKFEENPEMLNYKKIIDIIKKDTGDVKYFTNAVKNIKKCEYEDNNITKIFQCTMGKEKIFIDCDLNVKPCLVVPVKYNLKEYSVKEAIELMNEGICRLEFQRKSKCQDCYKRKLCRYCPGRFFLESGRYDTPPKFYCDMADGLIKEFDNEV